MIEKIHQNIANEETLFLYAKLYTLRFCNDILLPKQTKHLETGFLQKYRFVYFKKGGYAIHIAEKLVAIFNEIENFFKGSQPGAKVSL